MKIIPMKGHLGLDAMSGLLFGAAPLLFPDEEMGVKVSLVGIGLFEIAAALSTETQPGSFALIGQSGSLADTSVGEAEPLFVGVQMEEIA
ncbi:MAG TPA: hypothetical protein VF177_04515 [Anaerolineae bacterium]